MAMSRGNMGKQITRPGKAKKVAIATPEMRRPRRPRRPKKV
jgi:hypothetical protein